MNKIFIDVKELQKLKDAAIIVDATMNYISSLLNVGVEISFLCEQGDKFIINETNKIYSKFKRGIAFPTTISVNNIVSNFSPQNDEHHKLELGDLIKIQLGVHIDGYPVISAKTQELLAPKGEVHKTSLEPSKTSLESSKTSAKNEKNACEYSDIVSFGCVTRVDTLSSSNENQETKIKKDIEMSSRGVTLAANEAAKRIFKKLSSKITPLEIEEIIKNVADEYKCYPVIDVHAEELGRFRLYANDDIFSEKGKREREELGCNKVYSINVAMTTGKPGVRGAQFKDSEHRATIYETTNCESKTLRLKSSKKLFSDIKRLTFGFPFHIRTLNEEGNNVLTTSQRMAVSDCFKQGLINQFSILKEEKGHFVARVRFTVAIMPSGVISLDNPMQLLRKVGKKSKQQLLALKGEVDKTPPKVSDEHPLERAPEEDKTLPK